MATIKQLQERLDKVEVELQIIKKRGYNPHNRGEALIEQARKMYKPGDIVWNLQYPTDMNQVGEARQIYPPMKLAYSVNDDTVICYQPNTNIWLRRKGEWASHFGNAAFPPKHHIGDKFLHEHSGMALELGLDDGHVIVDTADWKEAKRLLRLREEALIALKGEKP